MYSALFLICCIALILIGTGVRRLKNWYLSLFVFLFIYLATKLR